MFGESPGHARMRTVLDAKTLNLRVCRDSGASILLILTHSDDGLQICSLPSLLGSITAVGGIRCAGSGLLGLLYGLCLEIVHSRFFGLG